MRDINIIATDINCQLQQLSSVPITQDHDIYKAFITLLTYQSDVTNTLLTAEAEYMYKGWVHYIADKYMQNFWIQEGIIPKSGLEFKRRMKDYIVMNQLQMLGGPSVRNEHMMDVCLTFQLYSMRDVFSGFVITVCDKDRNFIFEVCRSALKRYNSFIQDITFHTTNTKGKLVIQS